MIDHKGIVRAHDQKLDHSEQTIIDLARLMGNTNRDHEKKRNLLGNLPQYRPNPKHISEFNEIPFYDGRFLKKRFIKRLTKLKAYFVQDDYEEILYMEKFGESKISKLSNHVEDIMIKEIAYKQFQSFNLKLEKSVANDDLSIMYKILQTMTW